MKEKYEVKDILARAKDEFHLDTYSYVLGIDDDERIIRNIQRYTQKNMTPISTHGRAKFYSLEQVEQTLYGSSSMHKYFMALSNERAIKEYKIRLKSDNGYKYQINEDSEKSTLEFENTLEKLKLDLADYFILMEDATSNKEFLTIEELDLLGKNGLFPRKSLTNEETELLFELQAIKFAEKQQNKAVQEMYLQKKMEIMINALFSHTFKLDESLLLEDVRNACDAEELAMPEPDMLRSMDRLQDFRYYCKSISPQKEEDNDE